MTRRVMKLSLGFALLLGIAGDLRIPGPGGGHTSWSGGSVMAAESQPGAVPAPAPERPSRPLSLREALEAALASNLEVAIVRRNPESARLGVSQAQGEFDPLLSSGASYSKSQAEPQSGFQAPTSELTRGNATLSQTLHQGFSYEAEFASSRFEQPSLINPISPYYSSALALSFNQPLLRGFGFAANTTGIEIAKLDVSSSEEGFRATVIDTLAQVETSYWELAAAISLLDSTNQGLNLAQDLLDLNRKKVEVGTLAPIQITEAEASVAAREEGVILAGAAIRNAEDNLRRLMNVPPDSPDWDLAIEQTDEVPFEPAVPDLEEMTRLALEQRPELIQGRNSVRSSELSYKFARNARLPGLGAFGRYGAAGNNFENVSLGSSFVDQDMDGTFDDTNGNGTVDWKDKVEFTELRLEGWGDSVSEILDNDIYDWNVGLNFSIPLGNRTAKANEARQRIAFEQTEMSLENLERSIRVAVRSAVRAVETGIKRVQAARVNIGLQEKKLEAEQKRYDNGMSTSFQVLTFQNDLTSARNSEIVAITAYNRALVELGRVTATLPERRGIAIVKP